MQNSTTVQYSPSLYNSSEAVENDTVLQDADQQENSSPMAPQHNPPSSSSSSIVNKNNSTLYTNQTKQVNSLNPQLASVMASFLDSKRTPLRTMQKNSSVLPDSSCQALRAKIDAYRKRRSTGQTPIVGGDMDHPTNMTPKISRASLHSKKSTKENNENAYDKNSLNVPPLQETSGGNKIGTLKSLNSTLRKQLNEKNTRVQVLEKLLAEQAEQLEEYNRAKEAEKRHAEWLHHIEELQTRLAQCSTKHLLRQERNSQKTLGEQWNGKFVFELSNGMLEEVSEDAQHFLQLIESSDSAESSTTTMVQFAKATLKQINEEALLQQTLNNVSLKYVEVMMQKDAQLREQLRNKRDSLSLNERRHRAHPYADENGGDINNEFHSSINDSSNSRRRKSSSKRRWSVFRGGDRKKKTKR